MNPIVNKKLELIDRMNERARAARADAEAFRELTGQHAPGEYPEIDEMDCLDREDIRAIIRGYRAGHMANSVAVEETPSAAQVDKPRATPAPAIARPAPKIITDVSVIVTNEPTASIPAAEPMHLQQVGRAERPALVVAPATQAETTGEWITHAGSIRMPASIDKDDAIAYRMRDGSILSTDYPYDLNWFHEGEAEDLVAYRLLTEQEAADMLPWTEWNGGDCPVDAEAMVQVRLKNYGQNEAVCAGQIDWSHRPTGHENNRINVVAYRLVTA